MISCETASAWKSLIFNKRDSKYSDLQRSLNELSDDEGDERDEGDLGDGGDEHNEVDEYIISYVN